MLLNAPVASGCLRSSSTMWRDSVTTLGSGISPLRCVGWLGVRRIIPTPDFPGNRRSIGRALRGQAPAPVVAGAHGERPLQVGPVHPRAGGLQPTDRTRVGVAEAVPPPDRDERGLRARGREQLLGGAGLAAVVADLEDLHRAPGERQ